MILKKIIVENLRSYQHQEIAFPRGSTLLSGDIGTGKTTLLLAIEFALFGLQPGQKGTSLLRNGADEGKVILDFEIDNRRITVERTLKRSKKSVSQDYSCITLDNEKFEESITEIKTKILKLINYPPEFTKKTNLLYRFTVYTPQEEMKQIILEPGDLRLDTLRYVFGIDKYKRIEENASILTSKLREKIRINEGIVYDLEEHKESLKNKKENLSVLKENQKKAIENFKQSMQFREEKEKELGEIQEKINEKKSFENEKSKSLVLISEKNQHLITLQNNIKSLQMQIEESKKIMFSKEEYNSLNDRIKFQEKKEEEFQNACIETVGKINSLESKRKEMESLKLKISGLKKCPTCLQEVSEEYKKNIFLKADEELETTKNFFEELSKNKDEILKEIDSIKKIKEEFKRKKSGLDLLKLRLEHISEKELRIAEIEQQKKLIEKDLEILSKHVRTIEMSISEFSKYDSIFERINKELLDAKKNENSCAIKLAEINKEIQFSEQQIKEKESEIKRKEDIKKKTEKLREMEYWISEKFINLLLLIEKQVMAALKEEFSKLFSKWFSILVSDSLNARLDDNFSPVIEHQDYELDYAFLSGGERTAIALAYRLSLNQVINSILSNIKTRSLVILDEPTDGFSSQQLDKMRDVLNQLEIEQLIIVSHEPKIESFVDNIIRISKDSGVTKVG